MSQPKIAKYGPYLIDEKPGKKAWCSCGLSNKQPYCDGSHKGTAYAPLIVEITEERKVAWCGCKHTGRPPYCDGSHGELPQ